MTNKYLFFERHLKRVFILKKKNVILSDRSIADFPTSIYFFMKIILPILLFLLFSSLVWSQKITKDQVQNDLSFLKKSIHQYNPTLGIYNPNFETESTELIKSVKEEQSLFEYFALLSQLCAFSNEGHYSLGTWQDTVHKDIRNGIAAYLPISVKIIQDQLYIWGDFTQKGHLSKGDELLKINGQSSKKILQQLYNQLPSDGSIQTYLEKQCSNAFPWFYYLYVEQASTFVLEYIDQTTKTHQSITIKALNKKQIVENYAVRYPKIDSKIDSENSNAIYELKNEEYYTYLKLKSFNRTLIETHKLKSKKFYKMLFQKIETWNHKHLIIDLRGNMGGRNEFADDIVPFILQDKTTNSFLRKTVSWKGKEKTYKMPKPSKNAYKGQIYILINGATFSAGSSIARYLKEYGNAIVIGEESGTRYEGFAAGSKQYVYLPNSNIRIGIPRYHIYFPSSKKQRTTNRGILPDHKVTTSISDIINNKDVVLEQALSLIK